ncbi:MAG: hypothetical protein H6818_17925 [Phycisphaerales bacterium]|nr:hypothetical protein [Phycisphaerales bacterium]MCB9864837.1 hypothetical protein [Phycisphaerales bacterium]
MTDLMQGQATDRRSPCRNRRWLARLGLWGFVFFLVKGLAWLIVPALLAMGLSD